MAQSSTLSRIHLELARTPDFPDGSARHGYEFIAPLNAEGHVDVEAWRHNKGVCYAIRFWGDEPEAHGKLVHTAGVWGFDYGEGEDDEPFFKLDRHSFTPGSYVTITEQDHKQYPFRVMAVTPVIGES